MAEKKEFKTTCLGCGNVTFRPYVDFDKLISEEQNRSAIKKASGGCLNGLFISGASMACLPLGCCMAVDAAQQKVKKGMSKEDRIKDYCDAFMCKKCKSTFLKTETITHDVE